jgi:hypothetical protein
MVGRKNLFLLKGKNPLSMVSNLEIGGLAPFSLMTIIYDCGLLTNANYMIAGVAKGGLSPNYFSPHNSPRATMSPFINTIVIIVAHPQPFNV